MRLHIGDEEVPARWEVCYTCKGRGSSSAWLGAFTSEEMYELGDEFREHYMEGEYDRPCTTCGGRTTVLVPDDHLMTDEQRNYIDNYNQQMASLNAMEAMERRYGA